MKIPRRPRFDVSRALLAVLLLAGVLAPPMVSLFAAEPPGGAPAATPAPATGPAPAAAPAPPAARAPAPPGAAGPVKQPETLLELLVSGGIVMIPIGLCSLIALAIAFERSISLRLNAIAPPAFLDNLKEALGVDEQPNLDRALQLCQSEKTPIAEVMRTGLSRFRLGHESVEKAMEDAGGRIVQQMKRSLRPLVAIANLSTLLGLLGTIYGLITAFQATARQTIGKAQMLAEGIYVALVTTAAGLTVAIPVLVIHLWLTSRVDKAVDTMDEQAADFLDYAVYHGEVESAPADAAPAPAAPTPKPAEAPAEGGVA